jgi:DNA polymerase III subunit alpha
MEIAQVMAGYTLGGADLLRRAMGKKIAEEMAKERPKFIAGATANGVTKEKAGEVFDLLEKFANYGFNKSHAAAYAVVSYQTAWLKANHPVEFMAGVMNCDIHLTDKLATYADEVRRTLGIEIVPPCVNRSAATFTVDEGRIVYALGALKNVGVEAMRAVVEARGRRPFVNLHDFARRVDMKRVGKRPLEMLARAGGFDQLDPNRRRVWPRSTRSSPIRRRSTSSAAPRRSRSSARRGTTCPSRACRRWTTGCRTNGWPRNMRGWASTSRAIRSTTTCRRSGVRA